MPLLLVTAVGCVGLRKRESEREKGGGRESGICRKPQMGLTVVKVKSFVF